MPPIRIQSIRRIRRDACTRIAEMVVLVSHPDRESVVNNITRFLKDAFSQNKPHSIQLLYINRLLNASSDTTE